MNKIFYCCLLAVEFWSCEGPIADNKHLNYQNIVIMSDLSSRVRNRKRPCKDIVKIKYIVQYFKDECVNGEKIGDRSSISFSTFSDMDIVKIDIDTIKNPYKKQQFINSTGKYKNHGLKEEIEKFENTVKKSYNSIRNKGLDLISGLIEKINNDGIIKKDTLSIDGVDTTFIKYNNHVHIFTDGYLEYTHNQKNKQFHFGENEINKVRKFCKNNKMNVDEALSKDPSLGLTVYPLPLSKYVNLHIEETHERYFDETLQTYNNRMGLRDNEILEAVWKKWATDTGFKSFEWKKY